MPGPRRPRRRFAALLALAAAAAGSAALSVLPATLSGAGQALLPDLKSEFRKPEDSPLDLAVVPGRTVLRFNGILRNAGTGPLELVGGRADPSQPELGVIQRIRGPRNVLVREHPVASSIYFATDDGHKHFHLRSAARYSLYTPGRREVAASAKVGFCLWDTYKDGSKGPPRFRTCGTDPLALSQQMGISPTWGDLYSVTTMLQWIDVTDLPPGPYRLRADADPEGVIEESNERNNTAWAKVFINGLTASNALIPAPGQQQTIRLDAEAVNQPGGLPENRVAVRTYEIVAPPANGTVTDADPTDPLVVYTPNPGYAGPDAFSYRVCDGWTGRASLPAIVTTSPPPDLSRFSLAGGNCALTPRTLTVSATRVSVGRVNVRLKALEAGQAKADVLLRGKRVAGCRRTLRAGAAALCRVRLKKVPPGSYMTVEVTLRSGKRVVAEAGTSVG
jgi:hypothetical protein